MKKNIKHILTVASLTMYNMGVGYFINYCLLKVFILFSSIDVHPNFGSGGAIVSILGFGILIPIIYLILIYSEIGYKKTIKTLLFSPILMILIFLWEVVEVFMN